MAELQIRELIERYDEAEPRQRTAWRSPPDSSS
jgi:hypothetical protein